MTRESQIDKVRRNLVTHNLIAAVTFEVTVREALGEVPAELNKDKIRVGPMIGCFDCELPLEACKVDPCRGQPSGELQYVQDQGA